VARLSLLLEQPGGGSMARSLQYWCSWLLVTLLYGGINSCLMKAVVTKSGWLIGAAGY
jgi:hypothetical protein